MTEISLPVSESSLLSPRTASYVAALIRDGDSFDYSKWLEEIRENEKGSKQTSDGLAFRQLGNRGDMLERRDARLTSGPVTTRTTPITITIRRSHRKTEDEAAEARLTQRLEKICEAWNDFQSSRARDAVYLYLASVFAIVEHYKVRRKTGKLLRHAFELADLPFDKNADPFTAIIRCTSDDSVDNKMISKWARALRYVVRAKEPRVSLKTFMKTAGGVNACAALYAQRTRRATTERFAASL